MYARKKTRIRNFSLIRVLFVPIGLRSFLWRMFYQEKHLTTHNDSLFIEPIGTRQVILMRLNFLIVSIYIMQYLFFNLYNDKKPTVIVSVAIPPIQIFLLSIVGQFMSTQEAISSSQALRIFPFPYLFLNFGNGKKLETLVNKGLFLVVPIISLPLYLPAECLQASCKDEVLQFLQKVQLHTCIQPFLL